ncbi:MAG: VTT domain-containing protein [Butyrivibrio sp.]|nr:VTT domain-containing protein [Butyrivibrio sp.]
MKKSFLRTSLVLFFMIIFFLLVYFFIGRPLISFVGDPDALQKYIEEKGILGYLVFGIFVIIQTASNCIPGLPFYLAAGYLVGGLKGAIICDFFATIGNCIAFIIGRKYGRNFLTYLFPEDKLEYVESIIQKGNPKLIHIIFMFLPLPKDTYAWLGYYSGENLAEWFIITFIARFPSIILYTYGGEKIMSNQYAILIIGGIFAALVYVVAAVYVKKHITANR